jgi:hypothetical protein
MRVKAAVLFLALLGLLFIWGTRAGRYQVVTLSHGTFLLVDTATSEWWLYSHNPLKTLEAKRRGENSYVFDIKAWDNSIPLHRRLWP